MIRFIALTLAGLLAALAALPAFAADNALDFFLQDQERLQRRRLAPVDVAPVDPGPRYRSMPTQRTYCVRTCDGYYFAIGFVRNDRDLEQHGAMCAASCDSAPMALYSTPLGAGRDTTGTGAPTGPAIEQATDATGQLYTALPDAYRFRKGHDEACTCQGLAGGLPRIPLTADPTLRDGDVVVMADGLKVFKGKRDAQHTLDDFVAATEAGALTRMSRDQILLLENRIAQ